MIVHVSYIHFLLSMYNDVKISDDENVKFSMLYRALKSAIPT